MKTWLFIDANNLAYRAFYALRGLSHDGQGTEAVFGFLRDFVALQNRFRTPHVAFCFDHGRSKRLEMFPNYKQKRRKVLQNGDGYDPEVLIDARRQIDLLRTRCLPEIGFKNVLFANGYEADDVIGSLVRTMDVDDDAIIVSSDQDMYQLLSERVQIHSLYRGDVITLQSFHRKFGVMPDRWPTVKAIAGCKSDCIPGVKGVGEVTACRYLNGELPESHRTFQTITAEMGKWRANTLLTKLPLQGTPEFILGNDAVTLQKWHAVLDEFGLESLRKSPPLPSKILPKR